MRVLAIAYTNYSSDPRVMREAEAIATRGDQIEVLCLRKPGEKKVEYVEGVLVRHLPIQRYRGNRPASYIASYLWFTIYAFFVITFLHLKNPYQIIHVHTMPDFLVFAAIVPRLLGAKVILDMHDFMPETFGTKFGAGGLLWKLILITEKLSTRFAHHIITVHEPYVNLINSRGVPAEKITAILNLPDQRIFSPLPFNRNGKFTITYYGTIAERHGIDLFLKALARLKAESIPVHFLLIGEGDVLPEIKQLAEQLQIQDMLELIDRFVNVREIPRYIQRTHLGIIPYRYDAATRYMLPVKLLEYVFMDVPVVASGLDTIRSYFDEDMLRFVTPGDVEALAEAVADLYYSEDSRDQLVKNARRFTERYNWEKESQNLYNLYDRLIHQA